MGYITSCPSNLGTALRISVHLRLVRLMARHKHVLKCLARKHDLKIHFLDSGISSVSNKKKLGITETEILKRFVAGIKELLLAEEESEDA